MRFLINVIDDSTDSATASEMVAIDTFNEILQGGGHWVVAGGLAAPSASVVIDNRGGAGITTEGPLVNQPDYISGFWIIDADDRDQALALAKAGSEACHRRVELREFL